MREPPNERRRRQTPLDNSIRVLERGLSILLGFFAIAIFAGAVFIMLKMDGGSQSQGGRFFVAIVALLALGGVDSQLRRLVERRMPLFSAETLAAERRYRTVSLLLLLISAVLLIGLAWFLP